MEVHISLIGRKNLSREIYRQLRQAILEGRLRAGDRLPATRELARRLSVSRMTVTTAYDQLSAGGFVRTRVGAGTFVEEDVPPKSSGGKKYGADGPVRPRSVWDGIPVSTAFARPARFDFRTGLMDASLFPHATWRRLIAREFRPAAIGKGIYGEPGGHRGLREAIARHIGVSRGVVATADDITVTNGTQQALDILVRVLLAPGDRIAMEDPGYRPPRWLFESHGLRVIGAPVDGEGLVVNELPPRTRVVYITPAHQYPLGMSMTLSRRLALLEWAERNDAAVIEDDYDSEFRFKGKPLEPLSTLDSAGRVVYLGSFSKTLLPTLRIGFIVSPPSLRDAVRRAKFVTDWHTPLSTQRALARFIDDGDFARHVRRMNRVYEKRHEMLVRKLTRDFADQLEVVPSDAGIHVSAFARDASNDEMAAVVTRASEAGVEVHELSTYGVERPGRPGLLLGYGAIPTADIEEGLSLLRACFDA